MSISPTQCRTARAALGLTIPDLAAAADVRAATVSHFERGGESYASTVAKLREALEKAGAVFIAAGEASLTGGAGVRLRG
jgi:transcriptional regulator with XRE-family HTH domain